jgi:hypothetical protein
MLSAKPTQTETVYMLIKSGGFLCSAFYSFAPIAQYEWQNRNLNYFIRIGRNVAK